MLRVIARPFTRIVERFMPDPFIFAFIITVIVFVMSLLFTDNGFMKTLLFWGDGYYKLWTFIGQGTFNMIVMVAIFTAPSLSRGMRALAGKIRSEAGAYALVSFLSTLGALFSWAFPLFIGGLFAKEVAIAMRNKGIKVHYPLLVASAYSGFVVWQCGISGSSQLFVATKGHVMEKMMGVIPVSQTIFAPYNIIVSLVLLGTLPILMAMLKPRPEEIKELPPQVVAEEEKELDVGTKEKLTLAQWIERQRWVTIILGAGLVIYLVKHFGTKGFVIDLNILGTLFLALGLLIARSPIYYLRQAAKTGVGAIFIVLLFPFYSAIMGMIMGTGLVKVISDFFVSISTAKTLPFWTVVSAGLVNMAIPSGGGQWVVQGPVMVEAAIQMGVPTHLIVNAVGYGGTMTDMIQPFWAIPLLAIAGLGVRDIMGYTFMTFAWACIVFSATVLLAA